MNGIDSAKQLTVTHGHLSSLVQLNGVDPEERLTPKMARRASRVAHGSSASATVWDNEHNYGYRLYPNSARKVYTE